MNVSSNQLLGVVGLVLVMTIAIFFRITMISETSYDSPIRNDAREYYQYAINLKYHHTYSRQTPRQKSAQDFLPVPDKARPPGYAIFLYPWVELPPDQAMIRKIQFVQVIIDTLTVLLTFMLGKLIFGYKSALFAAFLVAISPHLISMNIYLLSETLFTFSLVSYLYITALALKTNRTPLIFLSGVVLAVTMLIKPTMNYFFIFLVPVLLMTLPRDTRRQALALILAGWILALSPWLLRNLDVTTADSDKALTSLKNGSYPGLMYNNDPGTRSIQHRADPHYNDIKSVRQFLVQLTKKAMQQPEVYIPWYLIGKPRTFYSWDIIAGAGDIFVYPIHYSPYSIQ